MERQRKPNHPAASRVTASTHSGADTARRGRHRKEAESSHRGSALAAVASGAVLFGGWQIAAPALAQADTASMQYQGQSTGSAQAFDSADSSTSAGSTGSLLNMAGVRAAVPVFGAVTSGYGPRWGTTHMGMDFAGVIGTPVLAAADGTVAEAGPASGFGLWLRLLHDDGSSTVYGHVNETLVEQGQRVNVGQQIATVGNRGDSTGPHLHFETRDAAGNAMDPARWLAERGAFLSPGSLGSLS